MAIVRSLSTLLAGNLFQTQLVTKTWGDFQVIDPKIFKTQSFYSNDLYYLGGVVLLLIILMVVLSLYRAYCNHKIGAHLKVYQKRKSQSKLIALQMSDEVSDAFAELAQKTGNKSDDFLADNRTFERAVNELKSKNPKDPLLGLVQSMREQADFLVSNPQVAFVCSQMLEVSLEIRVFVRFKGKEHSFLSRILRVTESELWVVPPKVKGKVIDLSRFKQVEIRLYRVHDGEYSFFCFLKRQVSVPVHGLILNHSLSVQRISPRTHERIDVTLEREITYLIPKMNGQFDLGKTESISNIVTILDISSGGLRVVTEDLVDEVDVDIEVLTTLPEAGIRRKIRAKIVRIDRSGDSKLIYLHLMFTSLNERQRHLLEKFIHSIKSGKPVPAKNPSVRQQIKEAISPEITTAGFAKAVGQAKASDPDSIETSEEMKAQLSAQDKKIVEQPENPGGTEDE